MAMLTFQWKSRVCGERYQKFKVIKRSTKDNELFLYSIKIASILRKLVLVEI